MRRPRTDRDDMGGWSGQEKRIGAVTLFVEDLSAAQQFYLSVFGLPVHFEDENSVVFRFGDTLINLLDIAAAHELITPGVVASDDAGARSQFIVSVDNVDAVCESLRGAE